MNKTHLRLAAPLMVLAVITACGGGDKPTATSPPSVPATTAAETDQDIAFEGSVTTADGSFVKYPNGLVITFKAAEVLPSKLAAEPQAGFSLVRTTVTAQNKGTAPYPLDNPMLPMRLLYGADQYEADQDAGYFDSNPPVTSKQPTRLAPGSSIPVFYSWQVPTKDLGSLALKVDFGPGVLTEYTFTDVGKKLKR